ncbi:S46 family peptidase [Nannocystaceae bacterium ST9]
MRPRLVITSGLLLLAALALISDAEANEGKWKPDQIAEIHAQAGASGLELSAEQLWNGKGDERTGGLLRASVSLGGCTAAFVSREGLIATNHHCAYGALQANSSVEHDYLKDGFLAASKADELPAKGLTVKVLRTITDVGDQVDAALAGITDDQARAQALDKVQKQIVETCEAARAGETAPTHRSCRVAGFFLGSHWELHEYVELDDVRLVYAPPSAIGEFGGETDNWMWPRQTGDFSLLRAYVGKDGKPAEFAADNQPYAPAQILEPAPAGVKPGQFVAVLGFPGATDRQLWAAEIERQRDQYLPMRAAAYAEWIAILDAAASEDAAVGIKVAATKKTLANREKNSRGKLDGLARLGHVQARLGEDATLAGRGDEAEQVLAGLAAITADRRERGGKTFLIENVGLGPRTLATAIDLVIWAREQAKPDLERRAGYQERNRNGMRTKLEQRAKDTDAAVDVELLASFLAQADALPEAQRVAGLDRLLGDAKGSLAMLPAGAGVDERRAAYRGVAEAALAKTELGDPVEVLALFDDPAKLAKSKDPVFVAARALVEDIDAALVIDEVERGKLIVLGPQYFELLKTLRPSPLDSDANGTLRFSWGTIRGYTKPDGSVQKPQTVLAEALAKHTGEGEFDLPDEVLAAAPAAGKTRWADPVLSDLPLCFLMDGDTTGGNSGSPVIDGQGRLVGFNFDRVWENVAGDYVWSDAQSRNVVADVRYLLWMLDAVEHADALLDELGVAKFAGPPAPSPSEPEPASTSKTASEPATKPAAPAAGACSCEASPAPSGPGVLFGLLALAGLLPLRRPQPTRRSGRAAKRSTAGCSKR